MVARILHFQGLVIVLLSFLNPRNFAQGQVNYTTTYDPSEVNATRALWDAWQGTPNMSTNLPGWNNKTLKFCEYMNPNSSPAKTPSWQGVQCSYSCVDDYCNTRLYYVVGLALSNASIVGVLPPDTINNFSDLVSLELTGNSNLGGPLPINLEQSWINKLDLHDNAFNGSITNVKLLYSLLQLDLSGNQFNGTYPLEQFSDMNYLQELSIGKNFLYGEIPMDAFANKTELEILTLNDNNFSGPLPDLNYMHKLIHLDVSGNQFEGPLPARLPDITGPFPVLEYVNLARNKFNGTLNLQEVFNLDVSTSLVTVDLSENHLSGELPSWTASSLGSIQQLYLDNNNLSGVLNISQMFAVGLLQENNASTSTKLKTLSLINNSIHDVISDPYIIAHVATDFMLEGNPYCNNNDPNNDAQRCYCSQICFISPAKADSRKVVIIAATTSVAAVLLVSLIIAWALLLKNRRYKRYLQLKFEERFEELDVKPTIFTYSELKSATRDFHDDMKLGQGGYGAVYKGVLPSGHVVAIKQLHKTAQAHDDFLNEVALITGMKHRNLVNLRGCCLREPQRLLVYEYVDNYDVDQVLFGSKKEEMRTQLASWSARHKICLGIAHGLHYLHAMAHPRVIHRDIKAGNVLLNSHLEAKIADFGLALLFPDEQSRIMTVHVAGTKGYLAPEYAALGQLSDKVDVYSFGVLCLEIISGRHNIEFTAPEDQVYLSKWVWKLHEQGKLMDVVDPALEVSAEEVKDVQRFLIMCLQCISIAVEKRPNMARIVSILQGDTESEMHVLAEEGKPSSRLLLQSSGSEMGTLWELDEGSSTSSLSRNARYGNSSGLVAMQMAETRPR